MAGAGGLPAGWTITSPTTATFTGEFDDVSCTPATPLDPGVVQATCADWCGDGAVGDADAGATGVSYSARSGGAV